MKRREAYCPGWRWWIRAGERLQLGLGLGGALESGEEVSEVRTRAGLGRLRAALRKGLGMVEAMRASGLKLPLEGWAFLQAAEHTGRMGEAYCAVSRLLEERGRFRRELAGQLWYPVLLLAIGALVLALLILWVMPELQDLQKKMGQGAEMPWISTHLGQLYGWIFGGAVAVLLGAIPVGWVLEAGARQTVAWGWRRERFLRGIPVLGRMLHAAREARLLSQLGPLLRSGYAIPKALEVLASPLPNRWESATLLAFRSHLLHGAPLMESFRSCPLFSEGSHSLLALGEESGRLDAFMEKRAAELRETVRWWVQQAGRAGEPLMLVVLALAVGGMLLAYLLPMLQMLEGFQP